MMGHVLVKAPRKKKGSVKSKEYQDKVKEALSAVGGSKKKPPVEEAPVEEAPAEEGVADTSNLAEKLIQVIDSLPDEQKAALAEKLGVKPEPPTKGRFRGSADWKRGKLRESKRAPAGTTTMVPGEGIKIREEREEKIDPKTGKKTFVPTGTTKVVERGRRVNILSEKEKMLRRKKKQQAETAAAARRTRESKQGELREDEEKSFNPMNPPIAHAGGDWEYDPDFPLHPQLFAQKMKNKEGKWELTDDFQRHNSLHRILETMILNHPEKTEEWLEIPGLADKGRQAQQMGIKQRRQIMPHLLDAMTMAIKSEPELLEHQGLRLANPGHMSEFGGGGTYGPDINLGYIDTMMQGPTMSDEEIAQIEVEKRRNRLMGMAANMDIPEDQVDLFTQLVDGMVEQTGMNEEAAANMVGSKLVSQGAGETTGSVYDAPLDDEMWQRRGGAKPAGAAALTDEERAESAKERAAAIRSKKQKESGGMTLGDFMSEGMDQPHLREGASEAPSVPPLEGQTKLTDFEEDDEIQLSEGYTSLGDRLLKSILEDMWQRT